MIEREYDDLYNEGATDGYNPYRTKDDGEPLWSKIGNRIDKIQRLLNGIGDSAFDAPRKAKLEAERETLRAMYKDLVG